MFTKLFESLDEKVFTSEVKENLEKQFNEAVEVKSLELTEAKMEEKIDELEEKADEYRAILEKEMQEKEVALLDQVDAYLEKVVEDFVSGAEAALKESVKTEKADMIIEAMEAMLVATGVKVAQIVESKDSADAENQVVDMTRKYDAVIEENIKLEKENTKLLKLGIITEMKEGMSVVEAEKFEKLANLVSFENSGEYLGKLDTIKESVKATKKEETAEVVSEKIVEKVEDKFSFAHLI